MPKPEKRSTMFKDALGGDTSAITPNRPQAVAAADPVEPVEVVRPAARVEPAAAPSPAKFEGLNDLAFFRVPAVILGRLVLTTTEKMVLIGLCHFADDTGLSSPPSLRILAMCCGITEYWMRETLKGLEARGVIKTADDARRGRKYQLMIWPQQAAVATE